VLQIKQRQMINPTVVLLHGMFGTTDNWQSCAEQLSRHWQVKVPELPVFEMPRNETGVHGLVEHIERSLDREHIERAVIGGNSLGGHVALAMALRNPERIVGLLLAGSSGLFERGFDRQCPRRPSREWIKEKMREVFFEELHVTEALINEIHDSLSDMGRTMKIIRMAKSAKQDNLREVLHRIQCPVLLAWGADDTITPPVVAQEFKKYIPHAELEFIIHCGHAPNIERPRELSDIIEKFLARHFALALPQPVG
jgi:pimeloyl-ACP methyl ester carboxylesterase